MTTTSVSLTPSLFGGDERVRRQLTASVQDFHADHPALGIVVQHHIGSDFFAFDHGTLREPQIGRVGLLVIMEADGHAGFRARLSKKAVTTRMLSSSSW